MNQGQREALLTELHELQGGPCHGTAPITLQIGYVAKSNVVQHDGIVILEAQPAVLEFVMDWVTKARVDQPDSALLSASVVQLQGPHSVTSGVLIA